MAWNEPGGNGNQHDPWGGGGRKPDRNSGKDKEDAQRPNQGPPDLDEALKKLQDKVTNIFGGNKGGGSGGSKPPGKLASYGLPGLVAVLVVAIWVAGGFYLVDQAERGVVLRLGKYHETVTPGLHWNPPVIDSVTKVNVTRIRSFNQRATMLTRDENIVQVSISVQYVVNNPKDYLLNVRNPERTLEYALDSSLRHEVGTTDLIQILTEGREILAQGVNKRLQAFMDYYGVGLTLETINIESTSAPDEVQSAFDDVIRAREDRERSINQARTYENSVLPDAEGRAARIREEAQAYRESVKARAEGEANRFLALLKEYRQAPEVTRERLYITAMQEVLSNTSKVLVDTQEGSNNMMYLPLDRLGAPTPNATGSRQATTTSNNAAATNPNADYDLDQLTDRVIEQIRERQNSTTSIRREGR